MKLIVNKSVAASIAGIGMAALAAGCASSASTGGGAGPAATSGAVAGTQAAAPAVGVPSSTPAGTAPASPGATGSAPSSQGGQGGQAGSAPACRTSALKIVRGSEQAAAGSVYLQIDFTNTSASRCTLYGYPGVALTTGTAPKSQVGAAATRSNVKPSTLVTLSQNATASATLQVAQVLNYPTANCGPVSGNYLQVYPPGQTTAAYVPYQGKTCSKPVFVLGISTIQPGASA